MKTNRSLKSFKNIKIRNLYRSLIIFLGSSLLISIEFEIINSLDQRLKDLILSDVEEYENSVVLFNNILVLIYVIFVTSCYFLSIVYLFKLRVTSVTILFTLAFLALFVIYNILFQYNLIDKWGDIIASRRHTIGAILYHLTFLLYFVDTSQKRKMLRGRRKQLIELVLAAKCIEYYIPANLQSGDIITDTETKIMMKRIANALREKSKWIVTPKNDTTGFLVKSIADTLYIIINGNWDSLEKANPGEISNRQRWSSIFNFLLRIVRTALVAGLPVIGFLLFQTTSFSLNGTAFVSTVSILFLYEVAVLTTALDPGFSAKISNVKDMINVLPPTKNKP